MMKKLKLLILMSAALLAVMALSVAATATGKGAGAMNNPTIIHVGDYGAVPDDGLDDTEAIRQAIAAAAASPKIRTIQFDAGVYHFQESEMVNQVAIRLNSLKNIALVGAKSTSGEPATVLEMNLSLDNDIPGATHIQINGSKNIKIENMILDHNPRFATAGEIVSVDQVNDVIVVDILPGMPHFDGMKSYSANNWDLATKDLIPVAALTIGTNQEQFKLWEKVPGGPDNRYQIAGAGFSSRVEAGQGISWHFNVTVPRGRNVEIVASHNVTLNNVNIYSTLGVSVFARSNENLTFTKVYIMPEGNSLAVGPRDAYHLPLNFGKLLMDDIYVKGVRLDPINNRVRFIQVQDLVSSTEIVASFEGGSHQELREGDRIVFWVGDIPVEAEILTASSPAARTYNLTFADPLPPGVEVGSWFTPLSWNWTEAIIRNSTFEGNYGTAILYQGENLLVENSTFRNNALSSISLGPIGSLEGGFARNILIRNNDFSESTWMRRGNITNHDGTITTYENHSAFNNEPYNFNITIENNTFRDLAYNANTTGVFVMNAQNVELNGNTYANVNRDIVVHLPSTWNITINDAAAVEYIGMAGDGTPGNPYIVMTSQDLREIDSDKSAHYRLGQDIDLAGTGLWNPIGNAANPFTGTLDGNGYVISNMVIDQPGTQSRGFFGRTVGAVIRNIGLVDADVTARNVSGIWVGTSIDTVIENTFATGVIVGDGVGTIGGLVGQLQSSEQSLIHNSYALVEVYGRSNLGGLVGILTNATTSITNSYAAGTVQLLPGETATSLGGLVGRLTNSAVIADSYWDAELSGLNAGVGFGSQNGATGLASEQMKQQSSYAGWDFTGVWTIEEGVGYPTLRVFNP